MQGSSLASRSKEQEHVRRKRQHSTEKPKPDPEALKHKAGLGIRFAWPCGIKISNAIWTVHVMVSENHGACETAVS